jgi:hypothetical protein
VDGQVEALGEELAQLADASTLGAVSDEAERR